MANTTLLGARWPALAAEPAALAWLGIRSDLGLAPRTLDAYSQGLSEYLAFCAAVSTDPLTAGRDHVARYVRELTQRLPRGDKPRIGAEKRRVEGRPDPAHISSSIRRTQ